VAAFSNVEAGEEAGNDYTGRSSRNSLTLLVFESDNTAHLDDDSDVDEDVQVSDNQVSVPEHHNQDDISQQMRSFEVR